MARRVLESLRGVGKVFTGDVLLRETSYHVSVWIDDGARAHADGDLGINVDGHIEINGIGEAVVLVGPQDLTLQLEDGRRLPFMLTGTGGEIVARGVAVRST